MEKRSMLISRPHRHGLRVATWNIRKSSHVIIESTGFPYIKCTRHKKLAGTWPKEQFGHQVILSRWPMIKLAELRPVKTLKGWTPELIMSCELYAEKPTLKGYTAKGKFE